MVQATGRVAFSCRFQRAILAALCLVLNQSIEVAFVCFIKRCLFVDLCQFRVGGRYDKQISDNKEV